MLRYLVRGLVRVIGSDDLESITAHTNDIVAEDLRETDHFITFAIGALDASSGALKVVNAGHEPALILREAGDSVEEMSSPNLVLGINPNVTFGCEETRLDAGDLLILYTDGLTEATNEKGEFFTIECLKDVILAHRHLGAQQLAETLFDAVKTYAGHDLRDDATVLVMRRTS